MPGNSLRAVGYLLEGHTPVVEADATQRLVTKFDP